jgi:hypothetical protein
LGIEVGLTHISDARFVLSSQPPYHLTTQPPRLQVQLFEVMITLYLYTSISKLNIKSIMTKINTKRKDISKLLKKAQ